MQQTTQDFMAVSRSIITLFILTLLVLVASCSRETPAQKALRAHDAMEMAYRTNSIQEVKWALFQYLVTLSEQERNGITAIDFDMARARVHQRLFLIYRKTHETNKMEQHFDVSLKYSKKFSTKHGLQYVQPTHDILADKIEKGERSVSVRWKNE